MVVGTAAVMAVVMAEETSSPDDLPQRCIKFGVNLRAYHNCKRSLDGLNVSQLDVTLGSKYRNFCLGFRG
jgi:hypothetical protein